MKEYMKEYRYKLKEKEDEINY